LFLKSESVIKNLVIDKNIFSENEIIEKSVSIKSFEDPNTHYNKYIEKLENDYVTFEKLYYRDNFFEINNNIFVDDETIENFKKNDYFKFSVPICKKFRSITTKSYESIAYYAKFVKPNYIINKLEFNNNIHSTINKIWYNNYDNHQIDSKKNINLLLSGFVKKSLTSIFFDKTSTTYFSNNFKKLFKQKTNKIWKIKKNIKTFELFKINNIGINKQGNIINIEYKQNNVFKTNKKCNFFININIINSNYNI